MKQYIPVHYYWVQPMFDTIFETFTQMRLKRVRKLKIVTIIKHKFYEGPQVHRDNCSAAEGCGSAVEICDLQEW